jgi:hypothetical protein
MHPVEKKPQVGSVGGDGVAGKPSFGQEIVEKGVQVIGKLLLFQGETAPGG